MADADSKQTEDDERWSNGVIYPIANALVEFSQRVSLVEGLKWLVFRVLAVTTKKQKRKVGGFVVDGFVVLKFAYVAAAWALGWDAPLPVALIVYLLVWNSTTYFYRHLWILENASETTERVDTHHRERRRFVSLVFAMAFSMVVYAYIYQVAFPAHFAWPDGVPRSTAAISFSIGNALTSTAGGLHATDELSYLLAASQLVFTFGFVAMLLSNTIPKIRAEAKTEAKTEK